MNRGVAQRILAHQGSTNTQESAYVHLSFLMRNRNRSFFKTLLFFLYILIEHLQHNIYAYNEH